MVSELTIKQGIRVGTGRITRIETPTKHNIATLVIGTVNKPFGSYGCTQEKGGIWMAPKKDADYVLKTVEERGIRFVRFWFTDVLGFLKSFAVTDTELETAFEEGMGFDGSSIEGFTRIQESDMMAFPDPETFQVLPWRPNDSDEGGGVARMFCEIQKPDGSLFDGDPRNALRAVLDKAAGMGYTMYVGPELEFFYFEDEKGTEVLDHGGYFDLTPLDVASDLRRESVLTLEKLGIPVEYSHHEVAPSQHEIDLRYQDAMRMADALQTHKYLVKEIARRCGVYATFMPKPLQGQNGNGMHVHLSIFKDEKTNAFYDKADPQHLSVLAKQFIAGILDHSQEMALVTNQFHNSYKRLVPGYEAPVYIAWAERNRSAAVRIPLYKPGKEVATRMELRFPDATANPYFTFATMLAAGLDGVDRALKVPDPMSIDLYGITPMQREEMGIKSLPHDLFEAVRMAEGSTFLKETLGKSVLAKLLETKLTEADKYRLHVSALELENSLHL